jgi:hypothetical protein
MKSHLFSDDNECGYILIIVCMCWSGKIFWFYATYWFMILPVIRLMVIFTP